MTTTRTAEHAAKLRAFQAVRDAAVETTDAADVVDLRRFVRSASARQMSYGWRIAGIAASGRAAIRVDIEEVRGSERIEIIYPSGRVHFAGRAVEALAV